MNNYIMKFEKNEARQKEIRQLRLAHARHMEAFDRYSEAENFKEAHYWLTRASETHQRLLDLGEVAI
jgi:hypothetical protein